jgi:8-oxo-dGTP pyrophosphatase MutT (NUDIX family)
MSDYRRYVAGFLFRWTRTGRQVLLVRKNHPKWQANMLNGIGGGIEGIETAAQAMRREFAEEANYVTEWEFFANERGPGYSVFFFRHTIGVDEPLYEAPSENDRGEELEWYNVDGVKCPVIGNLHWLLPLALDPRPIECSVDTTGDIRKIVTW